MYIERTPISLQRKITAPFRSLPDFLLIGAQKSGTTSLFEDLFRHPCIGQALMKEIHYFDWTNNIKRSLLWYRSHFPLKIHKYYTKVVRGEHFVTGEASPDYLFYPHVPKRVAKVLPNVKLIVILRNPVDRAYSHYQHEFRGNNDSMPFEYAIWSREQELETENQKMAKDEYYCSTTFQCHTYLSRGIYWKQLENWMRYFSKKQFLVLCSESYFQEPAIGYKKITQFLGIPEHKLTYFKNIHQGNYKTTTSKETRDRLVEFYRPHNEKLYELIGERFSW